VVETSKAEVERLIWGRLFSIVVVNHCEITKQNLKRRKSRKKD